MVRVSYYIACAFLDLTCAIAEGTADLMDWAACKLPPLLMITSSSVLTRRNSARARTWRGDVVEVVHDRQERGAAGRRAARRIRHDVAVRAPVRARHL